MGFYRATANATYGLPVAFFSVCPFVRLSKACIVTQRNNRLPEFLNHIKGPLACMCEQNMALGIFRATDTKEVTFGGFSDGSVCIQLYITVLSSVKLIILLYSSELMIVLMVQQQQLLHSQ